VLRLATDAIFYHTASRERIGGNQLIQPVLEPSCCHVEAADDDGDWQRAEVPQSFTIEVSDQ